MFRISKLTDYGTLVMVYLAQHPNCFKTAKDITQYTHVALPTVTKLLKILTKEHLLLSHRGAHGGYTLAKPAEQISIVTIFEAIEGQLGLTECSTTEKHCLLEHCCLTRQNWRYISHVIYNALRTINLAQMAQPILPFSFQLSLIENSPSDEATQY